jgi:hypothetical protein
MIDHTRSSYRLTEVYCIDPFLATETVILLVLPPDTFLM